MYNEVYAYLPEVHRWHLAAFVSVGYFCYYIREVVKRPMLAVSNGPFKEFLNKNVPMLESKFWPTFWCVESRAQTVFASLVRSKILPRMEYTRREILTLKDGGEVALDWMEAKCAKDAPIVLILPGLTGESQAEYVKCLVHSAQSRGLRTCVFNNRGLGGLQLKTRRLYCAANYDDLVEVIKHIRAAHPNVPLGATGISMGGLILGNYLAVHSAEARQHLTAAQIISVPWNVKEGSVSIEKPYLNSLLNQHLASSLCATLGRCEIFEGSEYDMPKIMQSKTIKEFDANFTAKHFGFESVDHYYRVASLHDKLPLISVPCLCLSAADDPFQPLEAIPVAEAEHSTHVAIAITARGGHIGFLEGAWPNPKDQYMARLFGEYFGAALHDDRNFKETAVRMLVNFHQRHAPQQSEPASAAEQQKSDQ